MQDKHDWLVSSYWLWNLCTSRAWIRRQIL